MHHNKFLFNKTSRPTNFPKFNLPRNSTCFGQFLCPSSGFFHSTFGTGIYHAGLVTYTSAECTVENSWLWQRNCLQHVTFLGKLNLGKLVRLLVLLKRNLFTKFSGLPICQAVLAPLVTWLLKTRPVGFVETSAKITKISCITTQKSGDFIYNAAEAWCLAGNRLV